MIDESDVRRFIVFKIFDYCWALPIEAVLRVVNYSFGANRDLITMGMIQIGRHMIRALDLHQRLNSGHHPQMSGDSPFLVITRSFEGELCGIPVDEPPDLMEVSSKMMRSIPPLNSQVWLRDLTSGVILSPEEANTKPILLLDIKRALSASPSEPLSLPPNALSSRVN